MMSRCQWRCAASVQLSPRGDAHLCGLHHWLRCEHHDRRRRLLREALQPVPGIRRDALQLARRCALEIEHDQRKIAVAQQQIRRLHRLHGIRAENHEQTRQRRRRGPVRLERTRRIHKRRKAALAAQCAQHRMNKHRPRARCRGKLRQRRASQPAFRRVHIGETRAQDAARLRLHRRKFFREEMPEPGDLRGLKRVIGNRHNNVQ